MKLGLVKNRHDIPEITDYVFEKIDNPVAVDEIRYQAFKRINELNIEVLDLYVTGLTVALVEVINVCRMLNVDLTLWHYDKEKETYFKQIVI